MSSSASPAPDARTLRVIAVGPTGLEQTLRRDASVELIRARTPMDALGELADPIDDESPALTVVVVSTVADSGDTASERTAFAAALRSLDPTVRVVRTGTGPAQSFDATVASNANADDLRAVVSAHAAPSSASNETQQASRAEPVSPETHLADESIATALVRGQDVLPEALKLIRARCKDPSVSFVASRSEEDPGHGVLVAGSDGRVLGRLIGSDDACLSRHAGWLAGWLKAGTLQRELRDAAFRDHLTGAWNRRYFDRFLPACLERARERRLPVTLMVFDVDNFKQYNDRYGHTAGDEILAETVRLMDSVIRPHDRVCRIGGDEFAVIFFEPSGPRDPGSKPPSDVFTLAERFQQQICRHHFPKLGREAPGTLTISGGLATFPWDATTTADLIEHADQLAMRSKQLGKNALTLGPGAERYRAGGCSPMGDEPGESLAGMDHEDGS